MVPTGVAAAGRFGVLSPAPIHFLRVHRTVLIHPPRNSAAVLQQLAEVASALVPQLLTNSMDLFDDSDPVSRTDSVSAISKRRDAASTSLRAFSASPR
ncbi:MAG: hypothetical protein ABIH26_01665 [Candidatus Eisenbacteria bacterium]